MNQEQRIFHRLFGELFVKTVVVGSRVEVRTSELGALLRRGHVTTLDQTHFTLDDGSRWFLRHPHDVYHSDLIGPTGSTGVTGITGPCGKTGDIKP